MYIIKILLSNAKQKSMYRLAEDTYRCIYVFGAESKTENNRS